MFVLLYYLLAQSIIFTSFTMKVGTCPCSCGEDLKAVCRSDASHNCIEKDDNEASDDKGECGHPGQQRKNTLE